MTTSTVIDANQISLNGVRMPISGPVRRSLVSSFPEKQVFGDVSRETHPYTSILSLTSWPGGIGRERYATPGEKRCWFSTSNIRQAMLTLPTLAVQTADQTVTGDTKLGEYYESSMMWIYGAFGTAVRKYTLSTDSWGSTLHTLPAAPIGRPQTVRMGGTLYLLFATTGGFSWYDGSTWTDDIGQDTKFLAWHDDSLWGMDANGTLWNLTALAVQTSNSGTVSGVETNGSAAIDDTGAVFTAAIRDGAHWIRVTDAGGDTLTGFIGTTDVDTDDTRVQIFNSKARTTQNWVEGGSTAFDMADTPLTFKVYKEVTTKAQLPLPDLWATELFTGRDSSGNIVLYAMTKTGLWVYDQTNDKWLETELGLPLHPRACEGSFKWRDFLAIVAGMSVYGYHTGSGGAAVELIGPDRDDGVPDDLRGYIAQLAGSHNDLLALLDGADTSITLATVNYSPAIPGTGDTASAFPSFDAMVATTSAGQGRGAILGYDGRHEHWDVKWLSSTVGENSQDLIVSIAYDKYRAWWVWDNRVYYMDLPTSITNSSQLNDLAYAATSTHEYPWFDGDDEAAAKVALKIVGTAENMSTDNTAVIKYSLDYDEDTTVTVGTVSSDGQFEFKLPDSTTPTGIEFRAIRPIIDLARATNSKFSSPRIRSMEMEYYKKLPAKWGFECRVLTSGEDGLAIRQAISTAIQSNTLVKFNYRDESQGETAFWVEVRQAPSQERTGIDHGDSIDLVLLEV